MNNICGQYQPESMKPSLDTLSLAAATAASAAADADGSVSSDMLLVQLKIISQIRPNEKVCSRGVLLRVDDSGRAQWLRRWWEGEGREDNVRAITRVIDNTIRLVNSGTAEWLNADLELAAGGVRNLLVTYRDDSVITAKLLVLLQKISRCVSGDSAITPSTAVVHTDVAVAALERGLMAKKNV